MLCSVRLPQSQDPGVLQEGWDLRAELPGVLQKREATRLLDGTVLRYGRGRGGLPYKDAAMLQRK